MVCVVAAALALCLCGLAQAQMMHRRAGTLPSRSGGTVPTRPGLANPSVPQTPQVRPQPSRPSRPPIHRGHHRPPFRHRPVHRRRRSPVFIYYPYPYYYYYYEQPYYYPYVESSVRLDVNAGADYTPQAKPEPDEPESNPSESYRDAAEERLLAVARYFQRGDYPRAALLAARAIKEYPRAPVLRFAHAQCLLAVGRPERAAAIVRKALTSSDTHPEDILHPFEFYYDRITLQDHIDMLTEQVNADPDPLLQLLLAHQLIGADRLQDAQIAITEARREYANRKAVAVLDDFLKAAPARPAALNRENENTQIETED